jgi:hypothetical protein
MSVLGSGEKNMYLMAARFHSIQRATIDGNMIIKKLPLII